MKSNQLLGMIALTLARGMTFPASSPASPSPEALFATHGVTNAAELIGALESNATQITLENDICLDHNLEVNRDELVLNFNGHKLIALRPNLRVLDVKRGHVTLMGPGELIAYGEGSVAIRVYGALTEDMPAYAKVTISSDIALYAPTSYGLIISPNAVNTAHGAEVILRGQIIAHDGIYLNSSIKGGERAPRVTIADNAKITADGETGLALHAAGAGVWQIGKATLTGAIGVKASSGELTFTNTNLSATAPSASEQGNSVPTGAAFQVEAGPQAQPVQLSLSGGHYTSVNGYAFSFPAPNERNSLANLTIDRSMFSEITVTGSLGVFNLHDQTDQQPDVITIKSGRFSSDVCQFLAPELQMVQIDGSYQVAPQSAEQLLAHARAQLLELLRSIEQLSMSDYTAASYQELALCAQTAQELLADESAERAQILKCRESLETARSALQTVVAEPTTSNQEPDPNPELTATRTALQTKLDHLTDLEPTSYTPESYHVLASVIEAAQTLLESPEVTQISLETSLHLLEATEGSLVAVVPDPTLAQTLEDDQDDELINEAKTCLQEALEAVLVLQPEDFESDFDFGALEILTERAQIILEDQEATMLDLRDVTQDLLQAMKYLQGLDPEALLEAEAQTVDPLDWSALRDLLGEIANFDPASYTAASYDRLLHELGRARSLLGDDAATQPAINAVVADINRAILALAQQPTSQPAPQPSSQPSLAQPASVSGSAAPAQPKVRKTRHFRIKTSSFFSSLAAGFAAYKQNRQTN